MWLWQSTCTFYGKERNFEDLISTFYSELFDEQEVISSDRCLGSVNVHLIYTNSETLENNGLKSLASDSWYDSGKAAA